MLKIAAAALLVAACAAGPAHAQTRDRVPPPNSMKLSGILAKVEQRPDFRYVSEVKWDDDGYKVTYYTADNARVEMKFDPVTAETKPLR